jgi:hypothetical protein
MRRTLSVLLALALVCAAPGLALAVNTDMSFEYALAVNGEKEATLAPGDAVTVSLTLSRRDAEGGFPMYAVQGNLRYNSEFFELVPDSVSAPDGVTVGTLELGGTWDGWTGISASAYSSALEGELWQNSTVVLTFQLKAPRVGSSVIFCEDAVVSTADGLDSYEATSNNAVVTVKSVGAQGKLTSFADVPAGAWYEAAVSYAVDAGLFTGINSTTFAPNAEMDRAMIATVLWRLAGTPAAAAPATFADVPPGAYYAQAVAWASAGGIITGHNAATFAPGGSATREQLAAMLYRYVRDGALNIPNGALSPFNDAGDVSAWAVEAMQWAVANGLISGRTASALAPRGTATRAEVATILQRFTEIL